MQEIINSIFLVGVIVLVGVYFYYKYKKFGAHEGYGVYVPVALGGFCIVLSVLLQVIKFILDFT